MYVQHSSALGEGETERERERERVVMENGWNIFRKKALKDLKYRDILSKRASVIKLNVLLSMTIKTELFLMQSIFYSNMIFFWLSLLIALAQ